MAKREEGRKKFIITVLLCNLFSSLTVVFFSPMEVVLAGQKEFYFPFLNAALYEGLAALALAGVLTLIMTFLPRKAGLVLAALSLAGGIAAYIQGLFLNTKMVALTGEHMSLTGGEKAVNLLIWAAVILAVTVCVLVFSRKRKNTVLSAMCFAAGALIAMQTVAMVTTIATDGLDEKGETLFLTSEGEFELSTGNNVVEIILDTTDGTVVRQMLARYPELYDTLGGWVYYPNVTSKHSRTYPSLDYMLTGEICHYDLPVAEFVDNAFTKSPFLPGLKATGADMRFYSSMMDILRPKFAPYADNALLYDYSQLGILDPAGVVRNLLHVALYKSMPYALKDFFSYDIGIINISSFKEYKRRENPFMELDHLFYRDLKAAGGFTTTDRYDKAFRLYHFWGNHSGYLWDEHLEATDRDVDLPDALRGSFVIVENLISEMKRLGVYDQATIIVTADHGLSNLGGETLEISQTYCPLLMVKYPGQNDAEPMTENDSPVAHDDFFATLEDALGAERTGLGSGKALKEFSPEDERERIFYYTALYDSRDGEVVEREYSITGNAEQIENWHLTGNWWEILYSRHTISKKRFMGE